MMKRALRRADSSEYFSVLWLVLQYMKGDTANYGCFAVKEARRVLNALIAESNAVFNALIAESNDYALINDGIIDTNKVYALPLKLAGEVYDLARSRWDTKCTVNRILHKPPRQFGRFKPPRVNWSPGTKFEFEEKAKPRPPRQHRSGFTHKKYV